MAIYVFLFDITRGHRSGQRVSSSEGSEVYKGQGMAMAFGFHNAHGSEKGHSQGHDTYKRKENFKIRKSMEWDGVTTRP